MLKGHTLIELTDSSGRVERVEHENLITNALGNIFGKNMCGNVDYRQFNPLWSTALGGILLMDSALAEDANIVNVPPGVGVVGHAGSSQNTFSDSLRGSPNLAESVPLENGFRLVWDFATDQANGNISSIGLTSGWGGNSGLFTKNTIPHWTDIGIGIIGLVSSEYRNTVSVDAAAGTFTTLSLASKVLTAKTYEYPFLKFRLRNDRTTPKLIDTKSVTLTNTYAYAFSHSIIDGYLYGFSTAGNTTGNATINIVKINVATLAETVITHTLANAQVASITGASGTACGVAILDGFYYVVQNSGTRVYKIELANPTNISLLPVGLALTGASNVLAYSIGNCAYGQGWSVVNGKSYPGYSFATSMYSSVIPIENYLHVVYSNGSTNYLRTYLYSPYLASINNITPITKTSDKTMKVIYTLTES